MAAEVLDSFALIAYFKGETSAEAVRDLLEKAESTGEFLHMSEVNYAEVKYMLLKKEGEQGWEEAREVLEQLPVDFHPATRELADLAAVFKARHKLSLADAFAAALAKQRKAFLVTGDPEFKSLEKQIRIRWL